MLKTLKSGAQKFRKWTSPIRHPLREIQRTIENCMRQAAGQGCAPSLRDQGDAVLLLDHLVRELVRMQQRIEDLQETVDQLVLEQGSPAVADTMAPPCTEHATSSHRKAG